MQIEDVLSRPFTFTRRARFVPCETRSTWMMALVCLMLHSLGRKGALSVQKMHVAHWIAKSDENESSYLSWVKEQTPFLPDIHFDPLLDRAIDIGRGFNFFYMRNETVCLTESGSAVAKAIIDEKIMYDQMSRLRNSKKYISDRFLKTIFRV